MKHGACALLSSLAPKKGLPAALDYKGTPCTSPCDRLPTQLRSRNKQISRTPSALRAFHDLWRLCLQRSFDSPVPYCLAARCATSSPSRNPAVYASRCGSTMMEWTRGCLRFPVLAACLRQWKLLLATICQRQVRRKIKPGHNCWVWAVAGYGTNKPHMSFMIQ